MPEQTPSTLRERLAAVTSTEVVAAIGLAGVGVACILPAGGIEDGPILCPFRAITGLPCPGCGMTRSWVYLMHGDLGSSLASNWFGPLLILGVLALVVVAVRSRLAGRAPAPIDRLLRGPIFLGFFALFLGFGVVRLALTVTGTITPI